MAEVVETLERHPARQRTIADHRHHPPVDALRLEGGRQAVGVRQGGGRMAVLDPVVRRLHPARVAGQSPRRSESIELAPPSGQQLVGIGLVAGVEEDRIVRRMKHPVQGDGQLHDAEIRAEMTAGSIDGVDHQ